MKDGSTKAQKNSNRLANFADFHAEFSIKFVVVAGATAGTEFVMESGRLTLGRGPGVDVEFADEAMSRQHAVFEFAGGVLQVRDLGSTNGIACNGAPIQAAMLEHGDQLTIGEHTLQLLVESRDNEPETYLISEPV